VLSLTDTFAAALTAAGERARAGGRLPARDQERLLALPGFDGTRYLDFLESLRRAGVEVEPDDADGASTRGGRAEVEVESGDPDILRRYLSELGRFEPLEPEEEIRVARRAREGDARARQDLILANLRLVVFLARRYRNRGLALLELVSEGNLGLVRAADRFDPERGVRFNTYAAWWIRQAILRGIAEQTSAVRLPATVLQQMRRFLLEDRRQRQRWGREVSPAEVGEALGLAPAQAERLAGLIQSARSIEELGPAAGLLPRVAVLPSVEELVEQRIDQERLEHFLRRLSEREEEILRVRYGFHDGVAHTLQQTGDRFGITRERVRQIEKRALAKLRRRLEGDGEGRAA
jgi:RNA polymerase sigma factor (sigma-70 family)